MSTYFTITFFFNNDRKLDMLMGERGGGGLGHVKEVFLVSI
jgi:hypothetical protein